MSDEMKNFPEEAVKKSLLNLIKENPGKINKFKLKSTVIRTLRDEKYSRKEYSLISFYMGDDADALSKKVNEIMSDNGYLPSCDSYIKSDTQFRWCC